MFCWEKMVWHEPSGLSKIGGRNKSIFRNYKSGGRRIMKNQESSFGRVFVVCAGLVFTVLTVAAQGAGEDQIPQRSQDVFYHRLSGQGEVRHMVTSEGGTAYGPSDVTIGFVSSEMGFADKLVKGAPYSAEAVTEMIQTLSDGNRIVHKNSASIYRDSEGRSRREQTMGAIGPWAGDEPMQLTFINDPVAGAHYVLEPDTKTARKMPMPPSAGGGAGTAAARVIVKEGKEVTATADVLKAAPGVPIGEAPAYFERRVVRHEFLPDSLGETKTEPLGKQVMEGLEVEGTRTTSTIPAGKIGNELPIQIVAEQWTSPALQVVVMSKHNDPRFGETTYRLTNINRSEPAKTLFEVPSDYTIKDAEPMVFRKGLRHSSRSNQPSSDGNKP
jgi:hypothetical protein